ncbi:MAG: hypothetical protein ABSD73_03070 [Candidatus Bathyarchaeia archaeon]|jgi:KaiC/GvpD/RAD55 family RecA-like ATPase
MKIKEYMTEVISQGARSRKRVLVTFDEDQVEIIQSLKGFGTKDAEIIRSIVMAYLSEHNYIKQASIDRDRAIEESDRKVKQASDESDRNYKLARARGNY